MNTYQRTCLPLLALLALQPLAALAAAPVVESAARAAVIRCNVTAGGGTVNAVHADKIIFRLTERLIAINPADQMDLDKIPLNSELDIKVLDNPERIADLRGKVLSFVGAVDNAAARAKVVIIDVDYAMVCPLKPVALPTEF